MFAVVADTKPDTEASARTDAAQTQPKREHERPGRWATTQLLRPSALPVKPRCGCTPGTDGACSECGGSQLPSHVRSVIDDGHGRPLDAHVRRDMEDRLGHDFSRVRVHADGRSRSSAQALGAHAYAIGDHVVMGETVGRDGLAAAALLSHELKHVAQADAARGSNGSTTGSPAAAEIQARAAATAIAAGGHAREPALPSAGLHRADGATPPTTAATTTAGPSAPAAAEPPRRASLMASRLVEWCDAGLLDPPFRPSFVPPIPPMPVTQATAAASGAGTGAAVAGAAAARPLPAPPVEAPPVARPPLRLVPQPPPEPVAPPPTALRAVPVLVFLTVLLWPSSTAPAWMDELNQITGAPYSSPEEYQWANRLTPQQQDYLRWLEEARRIAPDPALEDEAAPAPVPVPCRCLNPKRRSRGRARLATFRAEAATRATTPTRRRCPSLRLTIT